MKFIMSTQDIMAILAEFKTFNNLRINNVYDNNEISNQSIVLKMRSYEKQIKFIVIDAGKKIYLSDQKTDNDRTMPSGFVMKLRNHLGNKIMLNAEQFNYENIVDLSFGFTDVLYHLIIELNGTGNIIFTDDKYCIIAQLRMNSFENENGEKILIKNGDTYTFAKKHIYDFSKNDIISWYDTLEDENKTKIPLKKLLTMSPLFVFGKECIEHTLYKMNIIDHNIDDIDIDNVITQIKNNHIVGICKGYLVMEKDNDNYEAYYPILYEQFKNRKIKVYDTLSKCMDEYYRNTIKQTSKKTNTEKKKGCIDKEKQKLMNIARQIKKMEGKYKENAHKISVLEEHNESVDLILKCANSYGDTNETLEKFTIRLNDYIEADDINFKVSIIFENSNKTGIKNKKIRIVYIPNGYVYICPPNTSAYENISMMYAENKKLLEKIESTKRLIERQISIPTKKENKRQIAKVNESKETIESTDSKETIESTDSKETVETNEKANIIIKKKELWYQQFYWFISTDGILVLLGKNSDQNESLVKRFMEKDDLYMHSEMAGSGSCIIKRKDKNIPITTLEEANIFLMSHTKAWMQNSPDRTYWVFSEQVSKTPESGEYVTKGSFIIRGTKNFLSIPKMELGLTILFKNKGSEILTNMLTETTEFTVPMCAPYKTINKNKFKIKIVQGTGKIDKTIKKSILGIFSKQSSPKESVYIKEISIEDYQKILITGIKIL
ncbi:putative nuclear export mediator factor NEMF-like protein [Bodo saltans virus]|uniref:Nuclear export mediator factor NEMF-like protein n=1 Tax=Bodo saltans virus TaxID=2024608 RepID=A0A2H4UTS7_9VIRU|nr:putative nuclear export mediator factor NEMF-like protein [Bodo saltans virus]ATZ80225.1 putative nuclear export mediator factor NEMF-like protein [Bodo saltans virus]